MKRHRHSSEQKHVGIVSPRGVRHVSVQKGCTEGIVGTRRVHLRKNQPAIDVKIIEITVRGAIGGTAEHEDASFGVAARGAVNLLVYDAIDANIASVNARRSSQRRGQ